MKLFLIFLISAVDSLRPAFRAVTNFAARAPVRSVHTVPAFPWIASPGTRFVEIVYLSGYRAVGELSATYTMRDIKTFTMIRYADVFYDHQIDLVGRVVTGLGRDRFEAFGKLVHMKDKLTIGELVPPSGRLLQLNVICKVLPDAPRHKVFLDAVERNLITPERWRTPRIRRATITPNITDTD